MKTKTRKIRLIARPEGNLPGIVRIEANRKAALYALREIAGDVEGRGFFIQEIAPDSEPYTTLINGPMRVCSCQGFARWGHCKHHDGLAALIQAGRL